ncbi:hypothetical protein TSOC_009512 [Tetrabaena socialis]|uniref:Protein kinase domain-containing protein n=1 Tax=Tetrabaena socialis TaxID=47790 RepID=A0A2J7ZVM4_9CHLO|nr:hypothetical protein TSOC_009512 [Tetrabaena socialis]|eukprot:PNH04322.1 hypothetical protein TSOC_009512 [Tetrabaena socialis]
MGQCVSKPPDGLTYTAPPNASSTATSTYRGQHQQQQSLAGGGGNAAAAAASYAPEASAAQQHAALSKRSFRSSNRSVVESLASIYQVKAVLGSGCEGKTWLTQDLSTGALWAVKMVKLPLHTKMVQAIFREIRIQSELGEGHINIITPQHLSAHSSSHLTSHLS